MHAYPQRYRVGTCERGFTLAEVVVVISLISVLGGFALLVSMDNYRQYIFQTDRDTLITALHHARAQSIGNVCLDDSAGTYCTEGRGRAHGVAIRPADHPDAYVLFQVENPGVAYDDRDEEADAVFEASEGVEATGAGAFVFAQLSAEVASPGTITLTDGPHTSVITVGAEGQITWTH